MTPEPITTSSPATAYREAINALITGEPHCELNGGTAVTGDISLPLGALTHENVDDFYSKPEPSIVLFAGPGRFRYTAHLKKTGTAAVWSVEIGGLPGPTQLDVYTATTTAAFPKMLTGELRVADGEYGSLALIGHTSGGDTLQVASMSVQRVWP